MGWRGARLRRLSIGYGIPFAVLALGLLFTAFVTLPRVRRLPADVLNEIRPKLYLEVMALQWRQRRSDDDCDPNHLGQRIPGSHA